MRNSTHKEEQNYIREANKYEKWLGTFTKRIVTLIVYVSLLDIQLSYILAFIGKEQIAESLSSTVASTIIGVMVGYLFKALFETFFEKREERLRRPKRKKNIEEENTVND